jgi:hypothetical protein
VRLAQAWRLLDSECRLIQKDQHSERIVCVPGTQKKTLSHVLGLGELPRDAPGALSANRTERPILLAKTGPNVLFCFGATLLP